MAKKRVTHSDGHEKNNVKNECAQADRKAADEVPVCDSGGAPDGAKADINTNNADDAAKTPDLAAELEALKAEHDELKDRFLRVLAEYENYKKRTAKESASTFAYATAETVRQLLPVFDNLRMAAAVESGSAEDMKKGVEMILRQATEVFTALGVEEIPALGQTFDPELHNAVQHIEDESCGEQQIVEEYQKGYRLGDKIIRHSVVKVAN